MYIIQPRVSGCTLYYTATFSPDKCMTEMTVSLLSRRYAVGGEPATRDDGPKLATIFRSFAVR